MWAVRLVVGGLLLALVSSMALADTPHKSARSAAARRERAREREPKGPPSLRLESVDLTAAQAVVLVGGSARAPGSRLFVFHDDRDRHFIALDAVCAPAVKDEAAGGEGRLRCTLDLSPPYLKAHVVAVTLRLKGRDVAADELDVEARFTAAREAAARLPPFTAAVPMHAARPTPEDPRLPAPTRGRHRQKQPAAASAGETDLEDPATEEAGGE